MSMTTRTKRRRPPSEDQKEDMRTSKKWPPRPTKLYKNMTKITTGSFIMENFTEIIRKCWTLKINKDFFSEIIKQKIQMFHKRKKNNFGMESSQMRHFCKFSNSVISFADTYFFLDNHNSFLALKKILPEIWKLLK